MRKFLSFFKTEKSKALEIRADFRLGSDVPRFSHEGEVFVRAEFLNLAGVSEPEENYLAVLKEFCQQFSAKKLHATFATFEHSGIYFFNPIPAILSPKLLPKAVERIDSYQQRFGCPLAVRNFFEPQYNLPTLMPAADFFFELTSRSGAHFVCDVTSAMAFSRAFGEDVDKQLKRMTEIENASAFVRSQEELDHLKELGFRGPFMAYDQAISEAQVFCEGEFEE